jgi:hypothetical protein
MQEANHRVKVITACEADQTQQVNQKHAGTKQVSHEVHIPANSYYTSKRFARDIGSRGQRFSTLIGVRNRHQCFNVSILTTVGEQVTSDYALRGMLNSTAQATL